jgi:hypothetical protein
MNSKNYDLWIDASNGRLYDGWNSNNDAGNIIFRQGDKVGLNLHLVRKSNTGADFHEEVLFPDNCIVRVAVGKVDTAPTDGSWRVTFDGDTATIPYDATNTEINTLFNAIPSIVTAGGVLVTKLSDTIFKVDFLNVGVRSAMTIDATGLVPSCTSRRIPLKVGSSSVRESFTIKVYQTPVAFQSVFTDAPAPVLSVTPLTPNRATRISLFPHPRAGSIGITSTANILPYQDLDLANNSVSWSIADHWARLETVRINVSSEGVADFFHPDNTETDFYFRGRNKFQSNVTRVSDAVWDLTLSENTYYPDRVSSGDQRLTNTVPVGYTFPVFVSAAGVLKFNSKVGVLSFDTAEVEYLLDGRASATATIEVEIEDADGNRWTVLQTSCTVTNDLIDQTAFNPISYENSSIPDAPSDGYQYARKDGSWQIVTAPDIAAMWGNIGGDINNQTDLASELSFLASTKYDASNPAGYIDASSLVGYATEAWVGSQGFLGPNGGNVLLGQSITFGVPGQGYATIAVGGVAFQDTTGQQNFVDLANGLYLGVAGCGIRFPDGTTQTSAAITQSLAGYATEAWVTNNGYQTVYNADLKYQTILGMGAYATNNYVSSTFAPIASPILTGTPQAPTPTVGDATEKIATTAFVATALAGLSVGTSATTQVVASVRNETGATITKGQAVYINGAGGNKATVALARANAEATSSSTYGIVQNDISNNSNGTVVIAGIIENINTSAFVAGTTLYLSPSVAGGLTSVKPSAPNHMVTIGVVAYQHANQGIIQLRLVNGFEIDELHDVAISGPANNNLLAFESSTNLWKNKTANALGIAELSGATFTGKVNCTPAVGGVAGINIGIGGASAASLSPGDLWISTGGTNLNFRDGTGAWRVIATQGQANTFSATNTFSAPQIIATPTTASTPALRITNLGTTSTAHSLVVEDATNPDITSLVVNNAGNVGIGVNPASWTPSEKLDIAGYATSTTAPNTDNSTKLATTQYVRNIVQGNVSQVWSYNNTTVSSTQQPNNIVRLSGNTGQATLATITIPSDSNSSIPIGTQYVYLQSEPDQFEFIPEPGVGLYSFGGLTKTGGTHSVCTLIKAGANEWWLAGNLA